MNNNQDPAYNGYYGLTITPEDIPERLAKGIDNSTGSIDWTGPLEGLEELFKLFPFVTEIVIRSPQTSLKPLSVLPRLESIKCPNCSLPTLEGIEGLKYLVELICPNNFITDLTPLRCMYWLKTLVLSNNQVTDLSPLVCLARLRTLNCENNPIHNYDTLAYLSLRTLDCDSMFEEDDLSLPFIDSEGETEFESVYTANTYVTDPLYQETATQVITTLMGALGHQASAIDISIILTDEAITILEILKRDLTVSSVHGITYTQLIALIWARICGSTEEELISLGKDLSRKIVEARYMNLNNRFVHTVSSLNVLYRDFSIDISDAASIDKLITRKTADMSYEGILRESGQFLKHVMDAEDIETCMHCIMIYTQGEGQDNEDDADEEEFRDLITQTARDHLAAAGSMPSSSSVAPAA